MSIPRARTCSFKVVRSIAGVLMLSAFGLNTSSSSAQTPAAPLTPNQQSVFNYIFSIPTGGGQNPGYANLQTTISSLSPQQQVIALQQLSPDKFAQQQIYRRTVANLFYDEMGDMFRGVVRTRTAAPGQTGTATGGAGASLADLLTGPSPTIQTVSYVDGAIPMTGYNGYADPQHYGDPWMNCPAKDESKPPLYWGFNAVGTGSASKMITDGNAPGIKTTTANGAFGMSYMLADTLIVGLNGGYNRSHISDGLGFAADTDTFAGIGSVTFIPVAPLAITATAGYAHDQIGNHVLITIPGFGALAQGSQSGNDFLSSLNMSLTLPLGSLFVSPSFALQYTYMSQNGFTETAAGFLNEAIDPSNSYSLQTVLGLSMTYLLSLGEEMKVAPKVSVSYAHEFAPIADASSGTFAGALAGTNMTGVGNVVGRDYFGCGGGVGVVLNRHVSMFGEYGYQHALKIASHTGTGGFAISW
jgi:uncharacterized protein YhjY with autotransporter beta-barrel domain